MEGFVGLEKLKVDQWFILSTSSYWQHTMNGPGTNLSTEDSVVNNREKGLCSLLNVSGGGSISLCWK